MTADADRGPALPPETLWHRTLHAISAAYSSKAATLRLVLMVAAFVVTLFAFIVLLLGPATRLVAGNDISGLHGTQLVSALNGIRQTLVAAAAGFAAAVGLTFTARTYALSRRAQEVDRFTKAVSLLASDKQSERIGGLLTIEYVIREKTTEARAGVEVVCAFIRERSPVTSESYEKAQARSPRWRVGENKVPEDIKTALWIIGVNYPLPLRFMIDLSRTDLRGCGLAGTNFSGIKFFHCLMEGVSFVGADLSHCRLDGSIMTGAWLEETDLRRTTLRDVDLRGANLTNAKVDPSQLLPALVDDSTVLDPHIRERLTELKRNRLDALPMELTHGGQSPASTA